MPIQHSREQRQDAKYVITYPNTFSQAFEAEKNLTMGMSDEYLLYSSHFQRASLHLNLSCLATVKEP